LGQAGSGNLGPGIVTGIANVDDVSLGSDFSCVRAGSVLSCFGRNDFAQLGNGTTGTSSATPTVVMGISDPATLGAGARHACSVRRTGRVSCWGESANGALGAGSLDGGAPSPIPVSVQSLTNVAQIGGGEVHTCALTTNNEVYCWGKAAYGELGDGSTATKTAFIPSRVMF